MALIIQIFWSIKWRLTWTIQSPDLTPLDFNIWEYVKIFVYQRNLQTMEELR